MSTSNDSSTANVTNLSGFNMDDLLAIDPNSATERLSEQLATNDYLFLRDLVRLRKARNLSQEQVAEVLGIKQPSVAGFEKMDADPKLSTIRRYALAIGAVIEHAVSADEVSHGFVASRIARADLRVTMSSEPRVQRRVAAPTYASRSELDLVA